MSDWDFRKAVPVVAARQEWHCLRCGTNTHGWFWPGHSTHHRQLRVHADASWRHSPANLVRLCGTDNSTGCHGWAHRNRAEAERLGYIVPAWKDPRRVPVRDWRGDWLLLSDDGSARVLSQTEVVLLQAGWNGDEPSDVERSVE